MPTIVPSIITINNSSSFATLDAFDLKGTTHIIDDFNSASLAIIGSGLAVKPGKRKQGTIVSTTGSATEKPRYYVYTQTSSGDYNLSGSEWTTLSNWSEILTSTGEFTASFVTASNVHGPHGTSSIESSSYALTASYVANAVSASYAETASYVSAANIDQPFGNLEATGIFVLPDIPNVSASLAAALAGGDDLGNHIATKDLDLANNNIISASNISASGDLIANVITSSGDLAFSGSATIRTLGASDSLTITPAAELNLGISNSDVTRIGRNNTVGTEGAGKVEIFANSATIAALFVTESITFNHPITASFISASSGFTGSLHGTADTASYVKNAVSASYATASVSASYSISSSHTQTSISSSYALSSSYATTASYIDSASYSTTSSYSVSSSYSISSSYALSASYSTTSSYVVSASYSITSSLANKATSIDVSSTNQGELIIGDSTISINKLTDTGTPTFNSITTTTDISASGKLFASLSYDSVFIPEEEGGVVVYDTASGQFYYTGSYGGVPTTIETASFVTASNVYGPFGSSSILSASYAQTASYVLNAISSSFTSTASYVANTVSASYSLTSSHAIKSISSSYALTSSYAENSVSASYALTSSHIKTLSNTQGELTIGDTALTLNNLTNTGTPTFNSLTTTTTITAGTNISASGLLFASLSYDSAVIPQLEGGVVVYDTESGQFYYTGSYVGQLNVIENADTASFITASNIHGPHGTSSIESASYALTSSYVLNAISASYALSSSYAISSSYAVSSSYATTSSFAISASHAVTSSYIDISSTDQGELIIGDSTISINSLTDTGTPTFNSLTTTTNISASGKLFASLSYDSTPITEEEGGVVVYDTASGQFYYTGSYIGITNTIETASFITASGVYGPFGSSSILSASYSLTSSYIETASYAITASYIETSSYSLTASFVQNAISASYATSSSFATTASYIETASYALTSSHIDILSDSQGELKIGDNTISLSTLTDTGTPTFNSLTVTTNVSASGKLFASLSYDNSPIIEEEGGVVIYDTASGQFYYTGSYVGNVNTTDTASFVTASGVYGPYGSSSIESASYALTSSYILNAVSASYAFTSSHAINTVSSSYSSTSSYIENAQTASFITGSNIYGPYGSNSILSSSYAVTSSHISISNNNTQGEIKIGDTTISLTDLTNTGTPEFTHLETTTYVAAGSYLSSSNEVFARSLEVSSITGSYISSSIVSSSKYWGLDAHYSGTLSLPNFPDVSASLAALISGGITDIIQDTTPQLGGNLDLNGFNISGSGAISSSEGFYGTASWAETSSIALTSSYIEAANIDQPFTNITATGYVSADGIVNGNRIQVNTSVELRNSSDKLYINANGITGPSSVTNLSFPIGALGTFDLLKDSMLNLNIGAAATNINIGAATSNTTIADDLNILGDADITGDTEMAGNLTVTAGNTVTAPEFIGDLTGTADTASYVEAANIDQPFTYISASNLINTTANPTWEIDETGIATFVNLNVGGNVYLTGLPLTSSGYKLVGVSGIGKLVELTDVETHNITASGDISASGTIYADAFHSATGGNSIEFNDSLNLVGSITASSGISSSGTVFANLTAGTDNSVVVYTSTGELKTDEIDSRVWGTSLVDKTGTPANNQLAIWTDSNTLEGDTDLTYDNAGNLQLSYPYGANFRLENENTSLSEGDPIGAIIFRGKFSGGGDTSEPALIEAVSINPNLNVGDKTRAADLRFRVTPSGSKDNNQILRLNADSGSLFSGSVRADRFITRQDYQRPSASAAPIIGENFHGSTESSILRITGSIPSSNEFETDLFRVPSYNDSIQFNARIKFIDNGSYAIGAELTAQSTWDSSSLSLDGDNSHIDGFATLPPNHGSYNLYNLFNVSTGPVAFVGVSNFSLEGPSDGYITYKWSNNGADISPLAGYDYEMVIDYTVYKF